MTFEDLLKAREFLTSLSNTDESHADRLRTLDGVIIMLIDQQLQMEVEAQRRLKEVNEQKEA